MTDGQDEQSRNDRQIADSPTIHDIMVYAPYPQTLPQWLQEIWAILGYFMWWCFSSELSSCYNISCNVFCWLL